MQPSNPMQPLIDYKKRAVFAYLRAKRWAQDVPYALIEEVVAEQLNLGNGSKHNIALATCRKWAGVKHLGQGTHSTAHEHALRR